MRSLYILRHGTAEWTSPGGDHARPLQDRGRAQARTIGRYLSRHDEAPQVVFSSSAVRARETTELAKETGEWQAEIHVVEALYEAATSVVAKVVRTAEPRFVRVLVCGHQPTCGLLIGELTRSVAPDFPAGALARIDLELEDWSELAMATGKLEWIVDPGDKP